MNDRVKNLIKELKIKNLNRIKNKIEDIKKDKYEKITFTIIGVPKQTERPRVGYYKNIYVPNAKKNKKFIGNQIKEQIDIKNFDIIQGEVIVKMKFFIEIPKGFSNIDKVLAELGYIKPLTLPDIDNYMKTYMDAMTGLIWLDDGQVAEGHVYKRYSTEPRVEIEVKYKQNIHCSVLRQYAKNKLETYKGE